MPDREQHPSARSTTSDATPYRDAYLRLRAVGLTQTNAFRLAIAGYTVLPVSALALLPAPPVTPVAAPMSVVSAPPTLDGPTTPAPPRVSRSAHRPPLPTPSTSPLRGWQRWTSLAQCESSGDWHINTGNGYYGGVQMDLTFWRRYGGLAFAARPDLASQAQQIVVAERGLAVQGWGAWPSCSRQVGLR